MYTKTSLEPIENSSIDTNVLSELNERIGRRIKKTEKSTWTAKFKKDLIAKIIAIAIPASDLAGELLKLGESKNEIDYFQSVPVTQTHISVNAKNNS